MKKKDVFEGKKVFEMEEEQRHAAITKEVAEGCRHRLEKRWYRRLIELNLLIILVVVTVFAVNLKKNLKLAERATEQVKSEIGKVVNGDGTEGDAEDGEEDLQSGRKLTANDIPFEVTALFVGVLSFLGIYVAIYYFYANYCANSLRITEKNFPEVYALVEEYAHRLGIAVPKAYVVQRSGVLNAFSAFLIRKQWICIHSELFEVAYREHRDVDALAFVIAHEMAHVYYRHATLRYNLRILFSNAIPILGATASRAREYSCDRLAQRLTGTDGLDAMLVLVVDRHLYKMVDKEDYVEEMRSRKGFFLWAANLAADHPVMCKRVAALADGRGSGKLY